jgi:hypothetical protein
MFSLELKESPTSYDEYGQPCYPVGQEKGLIEFQENRLIRQALANKRRTGTYPAVRGGVGEAQRPELHVPQVLCGRHTAP